MAYFDASQLPAQESGIMKRNPHLVLDIVFTISLAAWVLLVLCFGVWMMPG